MSKDLEEAVSDTRSFFGGHRASTLSKASSSNSALDPGKASSASAPATKRPLEQSSNSQFQNAAAKKKLIVCSRPDNVLKYKAGSVVADLKESLDKAEMKQFKRALSAYKESKDISQLLEVIQKLCSLGKLSGEQVTRLQEFVEEADRKRFFLFASRL